MRHLFAILATTLLLLSTRLSATDIYTFDINREINSTSWIYTQRALQEADAAGARLIILRLNTYGGEVTFADSIRTAIMYNRIPVVAFIDNNAASAGALISIACRRIYMRPGASIGAATVVNGVDGQAMPDKYQSYMRATMRSTAEAHGRDSLGRWLRDPLIAEAMVDERIAIEGVIDSGKTLTFTTQEAVTHRYCEGIVDSIPQILTLEGYDPARCTITHYTPSARDEAKGWLLGTTLRGILIMLIIGGLYFELQQPGLGFPLIVSIISAVLYFAPLYIDGLAAYWEIALFLIGIALIVIEIFVTPGFGFIGISGIIVVILSLTFAMLGNVAFDFSGITLPDLSHTLLTIFIGLITSFIAILWLTTRIGSRGIFSRMALQTAQLNQEGYIGVDTTIDTLVGTTARTFTDLRPSGKIIVDGKTHDAIARHGTFIPKDTPVTILKTEGGRCHVAPTPSLNS